MDDIAALARRLENGPLSGSVVDGRGRRRTASMDAFDLVEALGGGGDTFVYQAFAPDVPGLLHNARRGDMTPLLRARHSAGWYRDILSSPPAARYFSYATYAASKCEESVLPWSRSAASDRHADLSALVPSLPPTSFEPFGPRAALGSDLIELCDRWPVASAAPDPPRVLPAIPTLILAAEEDLAAPIAHVEDVSRLIPGSQVLPIPGSGSELDLNLGTCIAPAARSFFAGRTPPSKCGPPEFGRTRARPAPPLTLAEVRPAPGVPGRPGRTLAAARLTLRDGAEMLAFRFFARLFGASDAKSLYEAPVRVGALRRGAYQLGFRKAGYTVRGASYVPGVRLSGVVAPFDADRPLRPRGRLRVRGDAAAQGRLTLRGRVLSGRLAGQPVRMAVGADAYPDISFGR